MKHGRLTDSSAIYDYRYHKTVAFQEGLQQKTLGKKQASLNWLAFTSMGRAREGAPVPYARAICVDIE